MLIVYDTLAKKSLYVIVQLLHWSHSYNIVVPFFILEFAIII